ncbi:ankyrin repeat domain-containing protein [Sodalis ligni]|uniref:ankyrin repeat domain-containing protein n=1 Tax=Sodalis ligni TaxID=2697027 RepID=UPI001BDE3D84|nr:ankyrin repeat domain-containing protein [Sodalis ligni]
MRETALHIATRKYFAEGIKALLGNSNINVNAKDHENRTPLDIALHNEYEDAINMLIFHPRIVFSKANRDTLSAFGAILRPRYPNRP